MNTFSLLSVLPFLLFHIMRNYFIKGPFIFLSIITNLNCPKCVGRKSNRSTSKPSDKSNCSAFSFDVILDICISLITIEILLNNIKETFSVMALKNRVVKNF